MRKRYYYVGITETDHLMTALSLAYLEAEKTGKPVRMVVRQACRERPRVLTLRELADSWNIGTIPADLLTEAAPAAEGGAHA